MKKCKLCDQENIYAKDLCQYHYWLEKKKATPVFSTKKKRTRKISKISKSNIYTTSYGERITQFEFNKRVRKAKEQKLEQQIDKHEYNFCEDCKANGNGTFIDCSHDIGIKKGNIEQAWDVSMITIRCRTCHDEYGDGKLGL